MSSKLLEKKYQAITISEIIVDQVANLKKAIISFSQLSGILHTEFIYTGNEKIPFNDMHPAYQSVLRHEFTDAIKKTFKEKKRF